MLIPSLSLVKSVNVANTIWQSLLEKGVITRNIWNSISGKIIDSKQLKDIKDYVFATLKGIIRKLNLNI